MSKVLVCGSEGSLMQAVIPNLIKNGHEVFGVDSLMRYGIKKGKGYKFFKADLTDKPKVFDIFNKVEPDYVIQGAAQIYGVSGFNAYGSSILGNDVTLHNNVLFMCDVFEVKRVVYISSSMVYETFTENRPVKETDTDDIITPKTEYGLSKFVGERLTKAFAKDYETPYTIWRPFNIITSHEDVGVQLGMSHVFADFFHNILTEPKNPLPIIGDGNQIRCFTNIKDVAAAIADYSFADITMNQTINLGNPEPVTMRDLAQMIYEYVPSTKPLKFKTVASYPNDVKTRIPDISKAKRMIGWNDYIPLKQSLDECFNARKN